MQKLSLIVPFILLAFFGFSQDAPKIGSVKGKVIDAETQQPVAYATITVFDKDNTTLTGGLSGEDGSFEIKEIQIGENSVELSFIGYDAKRLGPFNFSADTQLNYDLGTVELGVNSNELDAVVVQGEGPAVRYEIDKKVYDASKLKAAEGGTAKDVLEQIPSITVSSDQNIQLRGSQNVRVLINGRPSSYSINTLLEQVPQKNIKDIEIITNPSAKYDAEGEVGIINIILKENNLQGFTGGFNGSWGTENKWNGGGNFAYRVNKWNLSSSYNYNRFKDDFYRYNRRTLFSAPSNGNPDQISDEDRQFERSGHFARLGLDYYFDDKNTVFFSASANKGNGFNYSEVDSDNIYTSLFNGSTNVPLTYYNYQRFSDNIGSNDGYDLTASYQHVFGENPTHNILFDVSWNSTENDDGNSFLTTTLIPTDTSESSQPGFEDADSRYGDASNLSIKFDYTNPFDGKKKLEFGYKSTIDKKNENFDVSYDGVIFPSATGVFDYNQDVHAAYFTFEGQVNEKLGLKGGLRGEYTDISSIATGGQNATYEDDFLSLFPSAAASYKITEKLQTTATYSRRVARPGGRQLNPFADRTDQNNIFIGNNALKPSFTDSYEVGFNQFWGAVSLDGALYHRNVKDQIQFESTYNQESNVNEVGFFNLSQQRVYGGEASLDYQPKGVKWYSTRISGNYNYSKVVQNNSDVELNTNEFQLFSGNFMNNFRFDNGWSGQLNLNYQGPFATYVGELKAMYGINVNVSKQILKNKGSIYLRGNDLFNTFGLDVELDNDIRSQQLTLDWPSQMAFIGFNYNFGNLKQPARRKMERREERGDDQPNIGL